MNTPSSIEMLEIVSRGLDDLLDNFVFVGGAVASLYYDNPASQTIRPTDDVDCIIKIVNWSKYQSYDKKIESLGFRHDTRQGAPICRWIFNNVTVDIMTTDEKFTGFTNRWYEEGISQTITAHLPSKQKISILALPYYIASKIEAFKSRGAGDFRFSQDIEDIILILDSLTDLNSIKKGPDAVLDYFNQEFKIMVQDDQFLESVRAFIGYSQTSSDRAQRIIDFMEKL